MARGQGTSGRSRGRGRGRGRGGRGNYASGWITDLDTSTPRATSVFEVTVREGGRSGTKRKTFEDGASTSEAPLADAAGDQDTEAQDASLHEQVDAGFGFDGDTIDVPNLKRKRVRKWGHDNGVRPSFTLF